MTATGLDVCLWTKSEPYSPQKIKKLNYQVQKVTLENTEHRNHLISSSSQVDVFDLLIKIPFFNSLYFVSFIWLFSILFSSMLPSIDWFAIPSSLTTVLSSLKKGDCIIFLKAVAMIHIQYGPMLQTYVFKAVNFVCFKICCPTMKWSFKACNLEVVKKIHLEKSNKKAEQEKGKVLYWHFSTVCSNYSIFKIYMQKKVI